MSVVSTRSLFLLLPRLFQSFTSPCVYKCPNSFVLLFPFLSSVSLCIVFPGFLLILYFMSENALIHLICSPYLRSFIIHPWSGCLEHSPSLLYVMHIPFFSCFSAAVRRLTPGRSYLPLNSASYDLCFFSRERSRTTFPLPFLFVKVYHGLLHVRRLKFATV